MLLTKALKETVVFAVVVFMAALENEQFEAKAKKRRAAVPKPKRKSSGRRGG